MSKKLTIARARGAKTKAKAKTGTAPAVKAGKSAKAAAASRPAAPATAAVRTDERRRSFPEALRLRSLSASLTVDDLARSLDFYVKGLGFTVKERWEVDGKLAGVMLVAGSCSLGLAQDDWAKGRDRVKGIGVSLYAETGQSLDLIATLAREHGIKVDGPKKAPWGQRLIAVTDPDGFKFSICWPMS